MKKLMTLALCLFCFSAFSQKEVKTPPTESEEEFVFKVVEEMPRFPGCEDTKDETKRTQCANREMLQFIYGNLEYPEKARENKVEGTVVIRFVLDKNGIIRNPKIMRDIGYGCGKAALVLVKSMNNMEERWIPGQHRSEAVPVKLDLPVKFRLNK